MKPKVIYLDQWTWIKLAKAKKNNLPCKEMNILLRIKDKVQKGEWVLPCSVTHFYETCSTEKSVWRNDVSRLMRELSNNRTIFTRDLVWKKELEHGISVIKTGSYSINRIDDIIEYEDINIWAQNELGNILGIKNLNDKTSSKQKYENLRCAFLKEFPKSQQELEFLRFAILLPSELLSKKDVVSLENYVYDSNKEDLIKLAKTMPAIYCQFKMEYDLLFKQNVITETDYNDIEALSVAIPYCDVTFADKKWQSIAVDKLKLAREYGKIIVSDIDFLLTY
jgi:hypothetical protein